MEMVKLVGTEKQVEWAEKIRAEKIAAFDEYCAQYMKKLAASVTHSDEGEKAKEAFTKAQEAEVARIREKLCAIDKASFFIDERYTQIRQIMKKI